MIRTIKDLTRSLEECYAPDEQIFIVWVAKDEIEDVSEDHWKKILRFLNKRSAVGSELDADLQMAYEATMGQAE